MATFQIGEGFAANMSTINYSVLFLGEETKATRKQYVLDLGDGAIVDFRGGNFKYNKQGDLIGGSIEGYAAYLNGDSYGAVAGFDVSAKVFMKAASTIAQDDDFRLLTKIFSKNDRVSGNDQDDTLLGFGGNDSLYGGSGADNLSGGAGADRFIFSSLEDSPFDGPDSGDTITDFSKAQLDKIDLSGMGSYRFVGEGDFTGTMGEVVFFRLAGKTHVAVDDDGDSNADFILLLQGEIALTENEFIL